LYEKTLKEDMDRNKMNAIIAANAMAYATPAYDKKAAHSKQAAWRRFINSLTWERVMDPKKHTVGYFKNIFGASGVKIKEKGDK